MMVVEHVKGRPGCVWQKDKTNAVLAAMTLLAKTMQQAWPPTAWAPSDDAHAAAAWAHDATKRLLASGPAPSSLGLYGDHGQTVTYGTAL